MRLTEYGISVGLYDCKGEYRHHTLSEAHSIIAKQRQFQISHHGYTVVALYVEGKAWSADATYFRPDSILPFLNRFLTSLTGTAKSVRICGDAGSQTIIKGISAHNLRKSFEFIGCHEIG